MIFLDIDNLNILVMFILAFISFKGYQSDAHLFDSESEEELSQAEEIQAHEEKKQEESQSVQEISSEAERPEPKPEMKREEQKTEEIISDPTKMVGEENEDASEPLFNQKSMSTVEQGATTAENQGEKTKAREQIDEEKFESCQNEIEYQANSEFDSISNNDENDEEDEKNPESQVLKIKKIKKAAKLIQRDLKKQSEMLKKLDEAIIQEME